MKIIAGILFVVPDPPIPSKIFFLFLLILYLTFVSCTDLSLIKISGSLSISKLILFLKSSFAASITCWFFFVIKGIGKYF
tara:strand:+ start:223 stop:462 length:240 start_codon:yes stop_codon:yes gene_type:complete